MKMRFGVVAVCLAALAATAEAQTAAAVVEPARIEGYEPFSSTAAIAPTVKAGTVEVAGQPRMTQGHPCTLWDKEDIAHYKEMLKASKEMQAQLADLKTALDKRMVEPLGVPEPRKGSDGKWLYPGDYFAPLPGFEKDDSGTRFRRRFTRDVETILDLGIVYALTGEAKYGEYGRKLLLAYAHGFPNYGPPPSYNLRYGQGILTQLLDEGLMLTKAAFGYDLLYNLPGWTPEDRKQVHDGLLAIIAAEIMYPGAPDIDIYNSYGTQANNRGALTSTGVLAAGYATEDQELVNAALYGIKSNMARPVKERYMTYPPLKDWTAGTAEKPFGGLLATHLGKCIGSDGMWIEGSPSYAMYAGCGLVFSAEMMWHHGIDAYRYGDGALKRFFDFPLLIGYPDRTLPGLNDASRGPLAGGTTPILYEYAYRRYRDPRYLGIINHGEVKAPNWMQPVRSLRVSHVGSAPPAVLYDLDPNERGAANELSNMNFTSVGYGILRTPGPGGMNNLILSYGPTASHGHPDKLQIDLFAMGDVVMPSPGINYPYAGNVLIEKWYHTTVAHNTLTVDEKRQFYLGGENPKGLNPHADQVVYGPAATMGIQRAWTNTVYAGVTMDRAVFLTPDYLADLFAAFSSSPHQYDLAWHIRGEPASQLKFEPMQFSEPVPNGYNLLTNVRHVAADGAWSVTVTHNGRAARLVGTGAPATDIILADGGLYVDFTAMDEDPHAKPHALTILERRAEQKTTLYGNALDLSGSKEGYVKSVSQEGGLDAGYGLLRVTTAKGVDLCFAAYRPGTFKAGGLETDAAQALVMMDGQNVLALYLGGGKTLKAAGAMIERSDPGLAYVERLADETYVVGNPSPSDATVTVTGVGSPFKAEMKAGSTAELKK